MKQELIMWQYHDEWIVLSKGRAYFTLEGKKMLISAGDEPVFIPRWHWHSFLAIEGEAVAVKEKTDPTGEFKGL
jgi:quercetin dioxygenase-like cupin family protein